MGGSQGHLAWKSDDDKGRVRTQQVSWTIQIHLQFLYAYPTRNRDVHDPRALAQILEKAEAELAQKLHPDPYIGKLSYTSFIPTVEVGHFQHLLCLVARNGRYPF